MFETICRLFLFQFRLNVFIEKKVSVSGVFLDRIFPHSDTFHAVIVTQISVIAKLNGRKDLILRDCVYDVTRPSKELPDQS